MTLAEKLAALAKANLIVPAAIDAADEKVIDSLSDTEINALISIKGTLKKHPDFLKKHFKDENATEAGSTTTTPGGPAARTIGIVF